MRKINTRGIESANKVMLMAAIAYNLKKLLKYRGHIGYHIAFMGFKDQLIDYIMHYTTQILFENQTAPEDESESANDFYLGIEKTSKRGWII